MQRPPSSRTVLYLEIDSTFRNRRNDPACGDFVVAVHQSAQSNGLLSAVDPVSYSMPTTGATSPPGQNVTGSSPSPSSIVLDASTETSIDNYYINQYLEVAGNFARVVAYSGETFTATLATPLPSLPPPGSVYFTRVALPILVGAVSGASNTASSFAVSSATTLSSYANAYNNSFVRFLPSGGSSVGDNAMAVPLPIAAYDPVGRVITVQGNFPSPPVAGDQFELIGYDQDNFTPLLSNRGTGNSGSSSSGGKVEIELLWLSVPNVLLSSGYGGTFPNYPYLYVQLYNDGMSNTHQVMFSNNPNTERVLFKVPVSEYSGDKSFLTLKDAKMKQTISLRFDLDLHFTLTDPAGNIITLAQTDNDSPAAPNPLLQVNALFSVRIL